jgi:hypothetical protein
MHYEPNDKHKQPWQPGRKGAICPPGVDGPALLADSVEDPHGGGKRYATDLERAYCAQQHLEGRWHGYPEQWRKIPESLWRQWLEAGRVRKRDIKNYW